MSGQTTLLQTSAGKDPLPFTISVERTVRLAEFESLRLALSESFPGTVDRDQAYRSVLGKVEEWSTAAKPKTQANETVPPRPAASKLATLQERLGARIQDLEITDGIDGLVVRPRRYLGDVWKEVNDVIRALGGHWQTGQSPRDGCWRIPK
jgi:hypothetical protein